MALLDGSVLDDALLLPQHALRAAHRRHHLRFLAINRDLDMVVDRCTG